MRTLAAVKLAFVTIAILLLAPLASGCSTTRYYEREKLATEAMQIDADRRLVFILDKVQASRTGALSGFGGAAAGGCGCQ